MVVQEIQLPDSNAPSWDETFESDFWAPTKHTIKASIAEHALCHQSNVCGLDENGITWTRNLSPQRACRIASTRNLVAVSFDNGTVSILKGSDGTVLATRRVAPEGKTRTPAEISFVGDTAVLIEPPEDTPGSVRPILVAGMDGEKLNHPSEPGIVAEAARSMTLHALQFPIEDIRALTGVFLDGEQSKVRFALVDGDGHLSMVDYALKEKTMNVSAKAVDLGSWEIDLCIGLRVHELPPMANFLLLSVFSEFQAKLVWVDWSSCEVLNDFVLSPISPCSSQRDILLSVETLRPCSEDSFAVAIGMKSSDSTVTKIRVLQGLNSGSSTASEERTAVFEKLHQLYQVDLGTEIEAVSISRLVTPSSAGPFSFRFKVWLGEQLFKCHEFKTCPDLGATIGSLRLLISKRLYHDARSKMDAVGGDVLMHDAHACFHPVEIDLAELESVLSSTTMSPTESLQACSECMQRLAGGAQSGNSSAKELCLVAIDFLLAWPGEAVLCSKLSMPSVKEVLLASQRLKEMLLALKQVYDGSKDFLRKLEEVENRCVAMEALDEHVLEGSEAPLQASFAQVRSLGELFGVLVQNGSFESVENVWRSRLGCSLSTVDVVTAVMAIDGSVPPQRYTSLLREVVFGNLSINHEAMTPLLNWCCETANALDDDDVDHPSTGLEDSIFLLETVDRAIVALQVRVHSSFGFQAPFVETKKRNSDVHIAKDQASLLLASERSCPTILEGRQLKAGARKRWSQEKSSFERNEKSDEMVEIVKEKLLSARCLQVARSFGLSKEKAALQDFFKLGGIQGLAKELVLLFSKRASNDDERSSFMTNEVQTFCADFDASFDDALLGYATDLCSGKNTSELAIKEAASLARLGLSIETRCHVTLVALRSALFCRLSPHWLTELSKDAITWAAGNSRLSSELEEASRLLLIDSIVGRYCGNGAKNLFQVDNPRHAMKLIDHVSRHFDCSYILEDTLSLCDAFSHLSKDQSCSRVIENAILSGDVARSSSLFEELNQLSPTLACSSYSRVVASCLDCLESFEPPHVVENKHSVIQALLAITQVAQQKCARFATLTSKVGFTSFLFTQTLLSKNARYFQVLTSLSSQHSIHNTTMSDLREPRGLVKILRNSLDDVVIGYEQKNGTGMGAQMQDCRRLCRLLSTTGHILEEDLWLAVVGSLACHLATTPRTSQFTTFINDVGIIELLGSDLASRACLASIRSLCKMASMYNDKTDSLQEHMSLIVTSLSMLQNHVLLDCSPSHLHSFLDLHGMCDLFSCILFRTDEGIGETLLDSYQRVLKSTATTHSETGAQPLGTSELQCPHQPPVHSSWYVGDGLLLPPSKTFRNGLFYCDQVLHSPWKTEAALGLYSILQERGAHMLALRLVGQVALSVMSSSTMVSYDSFDGANQETSAILAERYLGGTGNGITSALVDSQMAVSCLLTLPMKRAFKIYKAALPVAMSTRNFHRLSTVASIGRVASSGELFVFSKKETMQNWARQTKFATQCRDLAQKAKWWNILQKNMVQFDPQRFDEPKESSHQPAQRYASSLINGLILSLSQKCDDPDLPLRIAQDYAKDFMLDPNAAITSYLEHILFDSRDDVTGKLKEKSTTPVGTQGLGTKIISLVKQIQPPIQRAAVLRNCLIGLEKSHLASNYELLDVVLEVYQSELNKILCRRSQDQVQPQILLSVLELVDRRRDALTILASIFQRESAAKRPRISSLLVPFPASVESSTLQECPCVRCNILDTKEICKEGTLDPLRTLQNVLDTGTSHSLTSSLASLCLPLGIPTGYIHARSLVSHFGKAKRAGLAPPSFELDVLPTLSRLKKSEDVAVLAEWCSNQYSIDEQEKLSCLDHSLTAAIKASNEAENQQSQHGVSDALERVRHLTVVKDHLADRIAVTSIFRSAILSEDRSLAKVIQDLLARLDETVWNELDFVPEKFVKCLLEDASLLAAKATVSRATRFALPQLRKLSGIVARACQTVGEKYSHVVVTSITQQLIQSWLKGDACVTMGLQSQPVSSGTKQEIPKTLNDKEEDDTIDFVMDLNILSQEDGVALPAPIGNLRAPEDGVHLTAKDEPSSCRPQSDREHSEAECVRSSLQIAFVLAQGHVEHNTDNSVNDENSTNLINRQQKTSTMKRKAGGILRSFSVDANKPDHQFTVRKARELLNVAFARSSSSEWKPKDSKPSHSPPDSRLVDTETVTFAMRHRALRAAAVLCPQHALEEVAERQGYLKEGVTLKKCTFAAFVAKETEELGLPLPHSDFAELSTMHYPSYSRALWRHHRDNNLAKGRLILLIVEMYLKEPVTDTQFLNELLDELYRIHLPRTSLLVLECILRYEKRVVHNNVTTLGLTNGKNISCLIQKLSESVTSEIESTSSANKNAQQYMNDTLQTVARLAGTVLGLVQMDEGQDNLKKFIDRLILVFPMFANLECGDELSLILDSCFHQISCHEEQANLRSKLVTMSEKRSTIL